MFVFVLSYLIISYYYSIDICSFSVERQKVGGSGWEGRWGGSGRSRGRENYKRNILCEKNLLKFKEKLLKILKKTKQKENSG